MVLTRRICERCGGQIVDMRRYMMCLHCGHDPDCPGKKAGLVMRRERHRDAKAQMSLSKSEWR